MKTLVLPTLAAALVGGVAACGSSSYTKQDFIAQANAICSSTLRQTRALTPPSASGSGSLAALGRYLTQAQPIVQAEADKLVALKRPPGTKRDAGLLSSYLAAVRQRAVSYRQLTIAAEAGDAQGVADAEASLRASNAASLAASYGLKTCGAPEATVA